MDSKKTTNVEKGLRNNRTLKTLIGIFIFIFSTLISLSALEFFLPAQHPPQKTKKNNHLYYPSNISNFFANVEYKYVLKTNDQGLRYRNIPLEKDTDTPRIFVLGDSFTEGVGVNYSETYSNLLEKKFSYSDDPILFINGGYRGTGPISYYLMFKQIGLNYDLDGLLIALYANDLGSSPDRTTQFINLISGKSKFNLKELFKDYFPKIASAIWQTQKKPKRTGKKDIIASITIEAENLGIPQKRIEKWKASIPKILVRAANNEWFNGNIFRTGLLYPEFYLDAIDLSSDKAELKWENMTTLLSEIIRNAKENGLEVAMIYIPSCFQYDARCQSMENPRVFSGTKVRKEWLTETTEIQKRLMKWGRESNLPFLDLTPVMRKEIESGDRLNYPLDGHWNAQGHEAAAEAIEKWLSTEDIFTFIKSGNSADN